MKRCLQFLLQHQWKACSQHNWESMGHGSPKAKPMKQGFSNVGYNIQLPLAGPVYKISAAFSFKECKTELISWYMIFQDWLLGRAVGVHLCRDVHKVAVNSGAKKVLTWDSVEITASNFVCFPNTVQSCFVEVALNGLMESCFSCSSLKVLFFEDGSGLTVRSVLCNCWVFHAMESYHLHYLEQLKARVCKPPWSELMLRL